MDHRIPKTGAALGVVFGIAALLTFLFLNNRFEGPDPVSLVSDPYELTAEFETSKTLPTKQAVLYKGVTVGRVKAVDWSAEQNVAEVTFSVDDDFYMHADAVVRIGERSLLGDPYLDVVSRGSKAEPVLADGEEIPGTRPSVDFDEALDFLDAEGRRSVKSLIATVGSGTGPARNGERLNGTVGGIDRTLTELHLLTRELRGQEQEIGGLVSGASTALSVLGEREEQIRTIVSSGRDTVDALGARVESLDHALVELPPLLGTGRRSLRAVEPLLADADPLLAKLRRLSPNLTAALDEEGGLPTVLTETRRITEGLPRLRADAVPILEEFRPVLESMQPLVHSVAPAARNLVPVLDSAAPRGRDLASGFALLGAVGKNKDEVGHYMRSGSRLTEPAELTDQPPGECDREEEGNRGCANAYPEPGAALDPQPFEAPYPRLWPCDVPARETPTEPCS